MIDHCRGGHFHDWRHLEQHAEYVNVGLPEEEVVTHDSWYCTRCRRIEKTERERTKTGDA